MALAYQVASTGIKYYSTTVVQIIHPRLGNVLLWQPEVQPVRVGAHRRGRRRRGNEVLHDLFSSSLGPFKLQRRAAAAAATEIAALFVEAGEAALQKSIHAASSGAERREEEVTRKRSRGLLLLPRSTQSLAGYKLREEAAAAAAVCCVSVCSDHDYLLLCYWRDYASNSSTLFFQNSTFGRAQRGCRSLQ